MDKQRHLAELPPLPTVHERPLSYRPRRPGERREPVSQLRSTPAFAAAAAARGLPLATAAELATEFALVQRDLSGLYGDAALPALLVAAEAQVVEAAIAPVFAPYLRALNHSRPRPVDPIELEEPLDLPLRFVARAEDAEVPLTDAVLVNAIVLERAAVSCGRTMTEYALLVTAKLISSSDLPRTSLC